MSPHAASRRKPRITIGATIALSAALLALAGCGSSSSSSSSSSSPTTSSAPAAGTTSSTSSSAAGASSSLSLAADPSGQLKYDKSTLTAKAGKVSIAFTNQAALAHNLTVESGGSVVGATPSFEGGSKTLSLTLKAGTYKFYCSVPGHRQAGMEGTLTVQ